MFELQTLLAWMESVPPPVVYGVLFGGALLEYVFPPFPGDMVVLAGAALVTLAGWSAAPVLAAVMLGAIAGSAADLALGRWLVRTGRIDRLGPRQRKAVDALVGRFRRHGAIYLALNRFVPGIRALFFVAAGIAGVGWGSAMLWSTVSALVWNLLLVGAGVLVGGSVERLESLMGSVNLVLGAVVVVVVAVAAWQVWRAVRRED